MWKLDSWKQYEVLHLPTYKDDAHLNEVLNSLKGFPPLVFAGEVRSLRKSLAKVAEGEGFLLQGGDCAESFSEFNADNIRDTFRVILQMAVILTSGTNLPVVKVGRMAGQFAKPRSSTTEIKNNVELESYKGDIINGIEFDQVKREPDPERMLKAYSQAASTLNLLRAFADGGYADLRFVNSWNMGFLKSGEEYKRYRDLAGKIQEKCFSFLDFRTPKKRKVFGLLKSRKGFSFLSFFSSLQKIALQKAPSVRLSLRPPCAGREPGFFWGLSHLAAACLP